MGKVLIGLLIKCKTFIVTFNSQNDPAISCKDDRSTGAEPRITVSMDIGAGGDGSGGDSYKTKLAELANKMSSLNYLNLESAPGQSVLEQNLPKVLSNPTISDHIR